MWKMVKMFFGIGVVLLVAMRFLTMPYDDTDDPENKVRSGMVLYTDYGTGCQYLKPGTLFGGQMTPRLDGKGNHVGCR